MVCHVFVGVRGFVYANGTTFSSCWLGPIRMVSYTLHVGCFGVGPSPGRYPDEVSEQGASPSGGCAPGGCCSRSALPERYGRFPEPHKGAQGLPVSFRPVGPPGVRVLLPVTRICERGAVWIRLCEFMVQKGQKLSKGAFSVKRAPGQFRPPKKRTNGLMDLKII